jgi:hypothetical protein
MMNGQGLERKGWGHAAQHLGRDVQVGVQEQALCNH